MPAASNHWLRMEQPALGLIHLCGVAYLRAFLQLGSCRRTGEDQTTNGAIQPKLSPTVTNYAHHTKSLDPLPTTRQQLIRQLSSFASREACITTPISPSQHHCFDKLMPIARFDFFFSKQSFRYWKLNPEVCSRNKLWLLPSPSMIAQGRIFHAAWAPMIAEHNSVRRSDQCSVLNGKAFAVIGVHIRLGDVAAKFDAETRCVEHCQCVDESPHSPKPNRCHHTCGSL